MTHDLRKYGLNAPVHGGVVEQQKGRYGSTRLAFILLVVVKVPFVALLTGKW